MNILKNIRLPLLVAIVVSAIPSFVAASMLGDTLTFRRAYPNIGTDFAPPVSTTVTADSSDLVTLQPPFWKIDPSANNILIDVEGISGMLGSSTVFDGIVVTGFSNIISNASFTTNDPAFVYGLTFDTVSIELNLTGPFDGSEEIDIAVEFASVPDAGSTVILIGAGLLGLAAVRRRLR